MGKMNKLNSSLINAIEKGDLQKVKDLAHQGADIHADNEYALRRAKEYKYHDIVKFLEEQEAVIKYKK